jgi:hypothetical protein
MRLGRLAAAGILAGAVAGFASGLLRPRPRALPPSGSLPTAVDEPPPLSGAGSAGADSSTRSGSPADRSGDPPATAGSPAVGQTGHAAGGPAPDQTAPVGLRPDPRSVT